MSDIAKIREELEENIRRARGHLKLATELMTRHGFPESTTTEPVDKAEEALRLFDKMVSEEAVAWLYTYHGSVEQKPIASTDRLKVANELWHEEPLYRSPFAQPKVRDAYVLAAEKSITEICKNAVEKLKELAPEQGWDSGEKTAEIYIRRLRPLLSATKEPKAEGMVTVRAEDLRKVVSPCESWAEYVAAIKNLSQAIKDQS